MIERLSRGIILLSSPCYYSVFLLQSEDESIPVAVKSLKPGKSEKEKADFLREAVIMGQFNHENIVRLHGVVDAEEPVRNINSRDVETVLYKLRYTK